MENKIILKVYRHNEKVGDVVRINKEAQSVLEDLMREHRLSARYIVSQMIIQGADFIEIEEES